MIDVPDIPPESLVSSYEAYRAIRALKCNKARGPDGISNRILNKGDLYFRAQPRYCRLV